jgi:hypothetical protein
MIERYGGKIPQESKFPYLGMEGKCNADKWTDEFGTIKRTVMVDKKLSLEQRTQVLKEALAEGPVEVSIAVSPSMRFYAGGVFNDPDCGYGTEAKLSHAVTAIGYGTDD